MTEAALASEAITIDPTTGLPELPEGYVWEVERNDHYAPAGYRGYSYGSDREAYAVAVKKAVVLTDETVHKERNPSHRWWNSEQEFITRTELIETEVLRTVATQRVARVKAFEELTSDELRRLRERYDCTFDELIKLSWDWESYADLPADATELMDFSLTEDAIKGAANEVFQKFQDCLKREAEKKANDERVAKLVGVYPPKKLGGN